MRPFAVEVEEVETVVADLAATQRQLELLAQDLDVQVRTLHGRWGGQAATAHELAHERWRASLEDLRAALDGLSAAGTHAAEAYRAASNDNVAMWGQVS